MAESPHERVHEVVVELQELLGSSEVEEAPPLRPLPDDWRTDPVKCLIAMVVADPTPPGVAVALAWFYGRGLADGGASPRRPEALDAAAVVLGELRRCIESVGLETVRRQIAEAMGQP